MGILLHNVSFHYPGKPDVLKKITLSVETGTFLGITGVNGSGKSTLVNLLNGLIPHSIPGVLSGTVTVDGVRTTDKSVSYFSRLVGMVFQNPDFSLFNLTVEEEILFGLKKTNTQKALAGVGLSGFEKRDPQTLSFGEKQKVCLASILARDVPYIVLDEPSAMLDYRSSQELYKLLERLHRQGKTIITIEHDTDYLWKYAKETIILQDGSIVVQGSTRDVLSDTKKLKQFSIKPPKI